MLVFLIDDDQAQGFDRGKDGGTRADGDAGAALANLVPLIVPFAGGKMAVQHRHQGSQRPGTEPGLEAFDRLGRKRNLRH